MQEYNLNLAEDNSNEMSNVEVFTSIDDGYTFETMDIIQEPTVLQRVNQSLSLTLEDDKIYKAKFNGAKVISTDLNKEKLGLVFEVYDGELSKEEYVNLCFYSDNRKCMEVSLKKLKSIAGMFGIKLENDDLKDLHSIERALTVLEGKWVEVKQTTRYDKKSDKNYSNIEVVSVLEKNYDLGGNL